MAVPQPASKRPPTDDSKKPAVARAPLENITSTVNVSIDRRISFMVTRLERGGAEKQLVQLALGLNARGWQVDIVSLMPPIAYSEELELGGVTVSSLGLTSNAQLPQAFWRAQTQLRETRPPILCTFNYHADLLGRVAGKLAGVPVVTSSLRNETFGGRLRDLLIRATTPLTPITTTNSQLAADSLVRRGVVPKEHLRVLPNGIVTDDYVPQPGIREATRAALGLAEQDFVWLTLGRLEPQKDHATLLRAFSQLDAQNHLLIAGEGALLDELKQQVEELELGERVSLLGLRRDVPKLLGAADAFVLSSIFEGLPNVIMEALASGLPVVSSDVGGVRELVSPDKSGLIVPPNDAAALAQAMTQLSALPAHTRPHWGHYGQTHIRQGYDLAKVIDQWETLFLDLLEQRR